MWIFFLHSGTLHLLGSRSIHFFFLFLILLIIYFFLLNNPNNNTHKQCFLNNFGAFGSGLATYDTMDRNLQEESQAESELTPVCDLVNVIERYHRPSMDSVTIVSYQVAGISTKLSNVVSANF
jgi:hypothetical protein